tara:strand:+ start:100 stop:423 length:324 start_codon:yes stop_codon:yes gene_type:complete
MVFTVATYLKTLGVAYIIVFLHVKFNVTPRDVYFELDKLQRKITVLEKATEDRYTHTQAALRDYLFAKDLQEKNPTLNVPKQLFDKRVDAIIEELKDAKQNKTKENK